MLTISAVASFAALAHLAFAAPFVRTANQTISEETDDLAADFVVVGGE